MLYAEHTSPEIGRLAPKTIALLPLASVEQHGRHLPLITDTALVTEVAKRVERALPKQVALLPTLWLGSSHHHLGFPGTVSVTSATYIQMIMEVVECLSRAGFRRIFLLNGHGGNIVPGGEVLNRLNQKWHGPKEPWVAFASYWITAAAELASQKFMKTPRLSHACEYETSMMLALRTDWVKLKLARGENQTRGSKFYCPSGTPPSRITVSESFHQLTSVGAIGSPELSTPEKGRKLFNLIAPVMIDCLKDFSKWRHPRGKQVVM